MCKGINRYLMVLCCGVLMVSGCAKKELVKEEPVITPPPSVTEPAKPKVVAPPVVKEERIEAQQVKEAPIAAKEETMQGAKAQAPSALLEKIFFDFDSAALSQSSRDILYKNAELLLKQQPSAKVQIEGHCDERGSDEYNLALGEKRAKSALNYLVTLGVQKDRLSVISYGKEKPADPGHDEAAWAKNRRDEFVITK